MEGRGFGSLRKEEEEEEEEEGNERQRIDMMFRRES